MSDENVIPPSCGRLRNLMHYRRYHIPAEIGESRRLPLERSGQTWIACGNLFVEALFLCPSESAFGFGDLIERPLCVFARRSCLVFCLVHSFRSFGGYGYKNPKPHLYFVQIIGPKFRLIGKSF